MNKDEAQARCSELAETSADRETHRWIPKEQADGSWTVVKLAIPTSANLKIVKSVSDREESGREDPRTNLEKTIPPGGLGM